MGNTSVKHIPSYKGYISNDEVDKVVKGVKECQAERAAILQRRRQFGCSDTTVDPCTFHVDNLESDPALFRKEVGRLFPRAKIGVNYVVTRDLVNTSNENWYEKRYRNCATVHI